VIVQEGDVLQSVEGRVDEKRKEKSQQGRIPSISNREGGVTVPGSADTNSGCNNSTPGATYL